MSKTAWIQKESPVSKTLLNRLAMFETLDVCGPLSITEIAHRTGLDVTVVSRTVSACVPDGWLIRLHGKVALGPRCTLLGHTGQFADVIAAAAPLVHAVAGATGLLTHAYGLVGTHSVLIAAAAGRGRGGQAGLAVKAPLHATAGGRAIAVQLDPARLDALLPAEPFPDAASLLAGLTDTSADLLFRHPAGQPAAVEGPTLPADRTQLAAHLDAIRTGGFAVDNGSLDPSIHCVAVPWPQPDLPASLACLGGPDALSADAELIRRVLIAAAQPGASPHDIIAAAAASVPASV
jgi:DNA-binding IclR family transcriptional regulator